MRPFASAIPIKLLLGEIGVDVSYLTYIGGIKAVIWTDVIQMGLYVGGAIFAMASHGSDQLIVQRVLACRNLKDGQKAMIGSGCGVSSSSALRRPTSCSRASSSTSCPPVSPAC